MKKLIDILILGGLLFTGLLSVPFEKPVQTAPVTVEEASRPGSSTTVGQTNQPDSPLSIAEVLEAHKVAQNYDVLSTFSAKARVLTSRPSGISPELASFFERHVSVIKAGNAYKRHTIDPRGGREQLDLSDGDVPYHALIENGRLAEAASPMTDSQIKNVELGLKTFGLMWILKQLADPTTEAVYAGRTAYGQDRFNVKTATGRWSLYTTAEHLICRLEVGDNVIEYAGYQSINDGVRLPFIQRLSVGGQLRQEIVFTRIDLNPKLPSGYFSREALLKELSR